MTDASEPITGRVQPPDLCHNGHPFVPGVSTDHAPGESDPRWCNTCGEAHQSGRSCTPEELALHDHGEYGPDMPGREVCGTFGCDKPPVVHGIRGDEWVPGDYCAEHGKNVKPLPSGRVLTSREDAAMTPKQVLHAKIVTTLTLSQGRGESVQDQAWDVLHELLEVGSDGIDRAAAVLLAVRQAWR